MSTRRPGKRAEVTVAGRPAGFDRDHAVLILPPGMHPFGVLEWTESLWTDQTGTTTITMTRENAAAMFDCLAGVVAEQREGVRADAA